MNFGQYMSLQSQVDQFRSQHNLFSTDKAQENTSKLIDLVNKEKISISNVNELTEKIIFFLQNGADINIILQKNIHQAIISIYHTLFNDFYQKKQNKMITNDQFDLFFKLIDEISILPDEESHSIAQNTQIPQILFFILESTKENHILFLINNSICNFVYEKPITANLFYNEKLLSKLYSFYTNNFCLHIFNNSYPNLYLIFRCFELVIIILFSNPKENQQLFDNYIYKLSISINNIFEKYRCEDDNDIYLYQLEMISFKLVEIFKNFEISTITVLLNIELLRNFLNVLRYGGKVTENILKILDIISSIFSVSFFLLTNVYFYDFRPVFDDFDVFQIYCSIWIKIINEVTNEKKYSKGRKQFILKQMANIISPMLQYFHLADQIKENQKILSLVFISFSYFDDKNILESLATVVPDIIERIDNELNEKNCIQISEGFFNLIKYYKNSETLQRIISKDLEKYFKSIIEKLKGLCKEKVEQLNDFQIIKIEKEEKEEDNDKDDQNDESVHEEIQNYFDNMKSLYDSILSFLEDPEESYDQPLFEIIEKQHVVENKIEFERLLKLLNSLSSNHHRCANFITKIQKIIEYFTTQIKDTFSNSEIYDIFKNNQILLLYLFESKIIVEDGQISCPNISDCIYKLHKGENDSYICSLIRNDSVEEFIAYVNQGNISLSSEVNHSNFETNPFLIGKTSTLIEYSAFFGAIQIFRFLNMSKVKLTPSLWLYSIHSQCPEMIHILEEYHVQPEDKTYKQCLNESIKCHHNDIANYIKDNLIIDNDKSKDNHLINQCDYDNSPLSSAFHNCNFDFIYQSANDDNILFYLCQYNFVDLVKLLSKDKNLNINNVIILNLI